VFGPHTGKYAIIVRPPFANGQVMVKLRESSRSDTDNIHEPFRVECSNCQLGVPRRRDTALVLAGPFKGHVGRVKAILSDSEVVLDNLPAVDLIPLRYLAWLHIQEGSTEGLGMSDRSTAENYSMQIAGRDSEKYDENDGLAEEKCMLCNQGGNALVRFLSRSYFIGNFTCYDQYITYNSTECLISVIDLEG
jgi:hypothetical protein